MTLSLNIPKHAEDTLRNAWGDRLDQAAFEGLLIESYRAAKLSAGEVASLLGLATSSQGISWLAEHGIPLNYSLADLEADRRTLAVDVLGFRP